MNGRDTRWFGKSRSDERAKAEGGSPGTRLAGTPPELAAHLARQSSQQASSDAIAGTPCVAVEAGRVRGGGSPARAYEGARGASAPNAEEQGGRTPLTAAGAAPLGQLVLLPGGHDAARLSRGVSAPRARRGGEAAKDRPAEGAAGRPEPSRPAPASALSESTPSEREDERSAPPTPEGGEAAPASVGEGPTSGASAGDGPEPSPAPMFRSRVLAARAAGAAELDGMSALKPSTWGALLLVGSMLALLLAGAAIASVEVTAEAKGVLRATSGLRPLSSSLDGSISEILAAPGARVEQGQVIARLDATALWAAVEGRERALAIARSEAEEAEKNDREILARATSAMQVRRNALMQRIQINAERLEQRRHHADNLALLVREGGASAEEGLTAKEALQEANDTVSSLRGEVALIDLELADRTRAFQERQLARRAEVERAEAALAESRALLPLAEVRAPADGYIESLVVAPGAVVGAGSVLAQLVPEEAPRTIVAFVPSSEIAFVHQGAPATVEVHSLSVSEFGTAKATVKRVSSDVATAAEVASALGSPPNGAVVRVELELDTESATGKMAPHLRSGDRVTAQLHRRERRLLGLLFDFARKWFE